MYILTYFLYIIVVLLLLSTTIIHLQFIFLIFRKKATTTLKKHGSEDKNSLYMSLIGRGQQRDLDMELSSEKVRNELMNGFRLLLSGK